MRRRGRTGGAWEWKLGLLCVGGILLAAYVTHAWGFQSGGLRLLAVVLPLFIAGILLFLMQQRTAWHRPFVSTLATVFTDVRSVSGQGLSAEYAGHHIVARWSAARFRDGINGTTAGRRFFVGTIEGEVNYPRVESQQMSQRGLRVRDLFVGAELRVTVPGWVILQADRLRDVTLHTGVEVEFESNAFNRLLDVYATDERIAYHVVDPVLLDLLTRGETPFLFEFRGTHVLVRLWEQPRQQPDQTIAFLEQVCTQVERNLRHGVPGQTPHVVRTRPLGSPPDDPLERLRHLGMPTE